MRENKQTTGTQATDQMYQLPNGTTVYHLNKYETDFTFKEIFQDQIYLNHGISIRGDDACVFDVGANIGLFVMFVKQICPNARIYAFEPAPDLCRLLRLNTAKYGESVQVFQCGISDEEKETTFTYYPNYSIMSGFYADIESDKQTLSAGVRNQMEKSVPSGKASDQLVKFLVDDKLKQVRQFKCLLRTVSSVLREARVDRIDLMKVDAERAEVGVLRGIDKCDWGKIDQIAMEVHSKPESESISSMLVTRGFKVKTEQEAQFKNSGVTNIFAVRR